MRALRPRRARFQAVAVVSSVALSLVVGAWVAQAQNPSQVPGSDPAANPPGNDSKAKSTRRIPLRLRAPAKEPGKGTRKAAGDPLVNPGAANAAANAAPGANANANPNGGINPNGPLPELGTYHYRFKVGAGNSDSLSASYYPSKLANNAPAVLLVHEREHSIKDFEEPLADLQGVSLADSLQKAGYAVLAVDLHGHGGNTRRNLTPRDWSMVPGDLEIVYMALVDRHNRGELNLAKFGVIAMGEGANVALAWAAGGGGVSSEGRAGDLGALILISPMGDAASQGLRAGGPLNSLAARIPIDLMVGERDAGSLELVKSVEPILKRYRANQVETFPSALHAYQLLRLEPKLTGSITKFLETTIKPKVDEWEGRYLLNPIRFSEIKVIPDPVRPTGAGAAAKKAAPR